MKLRMLPFVAEEQPGDGQQGKDAAYRCEKVLETVHIVSFALATRIAGDVEPIFAAPAPANE